LSDYSGGPVHEEGSFNILIAGKHGSLIDTMIFVHLDETERTIDMISIPRDLYYNGRKINHYVSSYGMEEFKRVLGDITGYELDKFILIDMYAFIDVVDLIGGIDLYLDQAVIDPTYKTLDDGVWGTLHYEPGAYHMNGREALRLARTRHTSSDFARSERQQTILAAIQKKARSFGFGDAGTLYDIVKTVLKKTETDISVSEAIQYYFRYQSFEMKSAHVISSGNILYVPEYVSTKQCGEMITEWEEAGGADGAAEAGERPDCENTLNAYTLLPRDNNWKLIKWYFREIFDGDGLDY
jgi:polyisoprenyl-teichoic acid--peptidoglycan teichoic acid transferase